MVLLKLYGACDDKIQLHFIERKVDASLFPDQQSRPHLLDATRAFGNLYSKPSLMIV